MIGSNVDVLSGRHQHAIGGTDRPIKDQTRSFIGLRILRGCWLGNSSVVMADVGQGAVIGAGSVVVTPIPDWAVAVGNPAVVKYFRNEESRTHYVKAGAISATPN